MAAAAINHLRDLPHKIRNRGSKDEGASSSSSSNTNGERRKFSLTAHKKSDDKQREVEKASILHWEASKCTLTPEEIAQQGAKKHVGFQSKTLLVGDFELRKTLGTGMCLALFSLQAVRMKMRLTVVGLQERLRGCG
jgi:hypothetical protein